MQRGVIRYQTYRLEISRDKVKIERRNLTEMETFFWFEILDSLPKSNRPKNKEFIIFHTLIFIMNNTKE